MVYLGVETQAATRLYSHVYIPRSSTLFKISFVLRRPMKNCRQPSVGEKMLLRCILKDYLIIEAFDVLRILGVLRFTVKWFTVSLGLDPKRRRRCTSAQAGSLLMQHASACFSNFVLFADHFVGSFFFLVW